jgi:hypothetical protein
MALLQAEGHVSREVGRGTFLRRAPDEGEGEGDTDPAPSLATSAATDAAAGASALQPGASAVQPGALALQPGASALQPGALALAPGAADAQPSAAASGSADYAPADVMTVRRLFEPAAMSLVVAWATDRDLAEMDRCLRGGERAADHDEFEVWDAALHRAIIAATRSPLLIRLYAEVERARHGRVWGDLKRRSATAARREEYRRDHQEIVAALRLRDADRATAAMRTHLARVSGHLLGTG